MSNQKLLTPGEVAKRIGIAEHTLAVWRTQRRHLRFVKVGRSVRYYEDDLDALLGRNTHEARDTGGIKTAS